jgi:hypothetical protein
MLANHHASRNNEKKETYYPNEAYKADQYTTLSYQLISEMRIIFFIHYVTRADLSCKVESEYMKNEDSTETQYIIDDKSLI